MTETLAQAPFTITHGLPRRAAYTQLAATAPVHCVALPNGKPAWLVTGYHEVRQRRRVEQLAPRIQQITDELLDAMAEAERVDLIASFALPLPLTVIYELFGVPPDHRREFHQWSSTILTGVLAGRGELAAAATAMVAPLRELVDAKRAGQPARPLPRAAARSTRRAADLATWRDHERPGSASRDPALTT